jgi:hypothetical protein
MMRFQRANHRPPAPGGQHRDDEFGRLALRKDYRGVVRRKFFCFLIQLRKGPAPSRCQIVQSNIIGLASNHLLPVFVKHCVFLKSTCGSEQVRSCHAMPLAAIRHCTGREIYRVRVNINCHAHFERSSTGPSRLCTAGEIIIHCKNRAQASRRENAASQLRAIC